MTPQSPSRRDSKEEPYIAGLGLGTGMANNPTAGMV